MAVDTYIYYVYDHNNTGRRPDLLRLGCLVFNYLLATALWWKCSTAPKDEKADRVTDLPDEVLSKILSPFTVRDVAHLSTVSGRWKGAVSTSVSSLVFNWDTMFKSRSPCCREADRCPRYRDRFVQGVNQFLRFINQCPKIVKFKVDNFCFGEGSTDVVDAWIHFAVERGVEELNLQLSCDGCEETYGSYVVRPELLRGSRLKTLRLRSCILAQGLFDNQQFQYLEELHFERMQITENGVKTILCSCLNLEFLTFTYCDLPSKLCISVPALQLQRFYVQFCTNVEKIEISSSLNLTWFVFSGREIQFSFCGALSLRNVSIRVPGNSVGSVLMNLLQTLPPIEMMMVNAATKWLNCLPIVGAKTFSTIKQLYVQSFQIMDFDILKLVYILEACPVLEKLFLTTKFCRGPTDLPLQYRHKNLKFVSLGGFHRIWNQIEFVKYILECSVALEKLQIDPILRLLLSTGWIVYDREHWNGRDRQRIRDLLQGFLKTTELVLL